MVVTYRSVESGWLQSVDPIIYVNLDAQDAEQEYWEATSDFYGPKGVVQGLLHHGEILLKFERDPNQDFNLL